MAGVGEVTAIWGALQIGFSIATVLTTYVADVREAKDDVRSLASELDSTLRHLEELDKLVDSNKQTKGWNTNGEKLVENCKQDSIKVVNQLVELIGNSGTNVHISTDKTFKREDIDLTIFHKASWPLFKPQVEIVKRELQTIKMSILLARDVYKASAGATPAEKEGAKQRLAGLSRGKVEALRQLREAKRKGGRSTRNARGMRFTEPLDGPSSNRRSDSDDESSTSSDTYSYHSVGSSLYSVIRADIEKEILERQEKEDREAKKKLADIADLQTTAVDKYKKSLLDAIAKNKQDASELAQQLESSFEAVPKAQIQQYVQTQLQSQIKDEELKQLSERFQLMTATGSSIGDNSNGSSESGFKTKSVKHKSSRISLWSSKKPSLPSALLRQEVHPDCARILCIVIKLDTALPVVDPVHVSMQWLIEHMKKEERESIKAMGATSQTMRTWAGMPPQCRILANDWLNQNTLHAASWSLVFARKDVAKSSARRRLLHRMLGDAPIVESLLSVLLVYRHSRLLEDVIRPAAPSAAPTIVGDTVKPETEPAAVEESSNPGILKSSSTEAKHDRPASETYRPSSSIPPPNSYIPSQSYAASQRPNWSSSSDPWTGLPYAPPPMPQFPNDYTAYNASLPPLPPAPYYPPPDPFLNNSYGVVPPPPPPQFDWDPFPSSLFPTSTDRHGKVERREKSKARPRKSDSYDDYHPVRRRSSMVGSEFDLRSRPGDHRTESFFPDRRYYASSSDERHVSHRSWKDGAYRSAKPMSIGRRSSPVRSERNRRRYDSSDLPVRLAISRPTTAISHRRNSSGDVTPFGINKNSSTYRERSRERSNNERRFVLYSRPDSKDDSDRVVTRHTRPSSVRTVGKANDESLSAEMLSKYGIDSQAAATVANTAANGTVSPPARAARSTSQTSPVQSGPTVIPLEIDQRIHSSNDEESGMSLYD